MMELEPGRKRLTDGTIKVSIWLLIREWMDEWLRTDYLSMRHRFGSLKLVKFVASIPNPRGEHVSMVRTTHNNNTSHN